MRRDKMKQTERLQEHLSMHKTITPLEAWTKLGIYRLSDTVFRLRKKGLAIETNLIDVENQFGETCHVAQYTLVD
jgi:hypothetical protein